IQCHIRQQQQAFHQQLLSCLSQTRAGPPRPLQLEV
ncbi:unnamed protein product, partial [Rotaria magnacalcarata]